MPAQNLPPLGSSAPPAHAKIKDAEFLVVHFPAKAERKSRDLLGRFTSLNQAMQRAFEESARDLQNQEVIALKRGLRRPQGEETGRPQENLVNALLSERNRKVTKDGFVVNLSEWLDSAESKVNLYWRGLEYGTSEHVGQIIFGFFMGADGKPHAPSADRRFLDPRMVVGHSQIEFGVEHGVKFSKRRQAKQVAKFFRIKHPIEAVHYIRKGTKAWEASGSLQKRTEAAIKSAGVNAKKA